MTLNLINALSQSRKIKKDVQEKVGTPFIEATVDTLLDTMMIDILADMDLVVTDIELVIIDIGHTLINMELKKAIMIKMSNQQICKEMKCIKSMIKKPQKLLMSKRTKMKSQN